MVVMMMMTIHFQDTAAAAAVESDSSPAEENVVSSNFVASSPTNALAVPTFLEANPRERREDWFKTSSTRESFSPPTPASLLSAISISRAQQQQEQPWVQQATDPGFKAGGPSQAPRPTARLGGQGGLPSWRVQPSYPRPSSTYTPTAGQAPAINYPSSSSSSFGSPPQQINYQRTLNLDVARALQLPHHPIVACPTEPASEELGFPKMDIASRPSVIQAMRNQPPFKSQRMTAAYPDTFVGNGGSRFERMMVTPRTPKASLVSESICDDRETEIILKYIHKKFSKYHKCTIPKTNVCFCRSILPPIWIQARATEVKCYRCSPTILHDHQLL